ncbi:STAS domain-containing protein [Kurthia massiliensis]|uniref:STAS domain-containing protein n=1 Tax=Kurthia massiliensis TaxID=1033739 RepID=UPI0002890982|nr:STAS domain-containing protein [Kurthia massiliensis]
MELTVNITTQQDSSVLATISGEIDAYTAPKLREQLLAIDTKNTKKAVLDLAGVGYMDSTGIGVIVAFYKSVIADGGELTLVGLSPRLKRLFDITGLSGIIHVEEEA